MGKEPKTKTDLEQLADLLFKHVASSSQKSKALDMANNLRKTIEYFAEEEPELLQLAQRDFRSSKYAQTRWCRMMLTTQNFNIGSVVGDVSCGALGLLYKLAIYAGHSADFRFTASKQQLAELTQTSVNTVRKGLKELIDHEMITVVEKATDRTPATYRISPLYLQAGKLKDQAWLDSCYEMAELLRDSAYRNASANSRAVADLLRGKPKFTVAKKRDGVFESVVLVPTPGDPNNKSTDD